jgi:hypothetical protein
MDFTLQSRTVNNAGVEQLVVNTEATGPILQACLARVKARFEERWPAIRPSGTQAGTLPTLDLRVYRYDFPNFSVQDAACGEDVTGISENAIVVAEPPEISRQALCRKNRAVRVSVSFSITPSLVFLSLVPGGQFAETVTINDTSEI